MRSSAPLDLAVEKETYHERLNRYTRRVMICAGTGCVANGSLKIAHRLVELLEERGVPVHMEVSGGEVSQETILVSRSGCQGFCQMGPLLEIEPHGLLYTQVKIDDVEDIVDRTLLGGQIVERLLYTTPVEKKPCRCSEDIPFYARQKRVVLEHCGHIDPEDIREYIARGGYEAARKVTREMKADEVCQQVSDAGLRGRGGGGFPTGRKWSLALKQSSLKKYIICNGDEGDPGAFMDRSIMEGNPHSVIEGMIIGALGIGSDEGYVYVRAEYPLAVKRLKKAVADAQEMGFLGDNIFGSGKTFNIHITEGAGAFVCGEASAMVASIEGNRGMPRVKPPRTAEKGLWGKPTIINNVETLASVPIIFRKGVEFYRGMGTETSPGTKSFALTGHVANTGLIEVPFGTTLREIIFDIGGGVTDENGHVSPDAFKAVQIGGPSGGCLTMDHIDLPLDFDSLSEVGAMVGSGGLVVMNKSTCMVKIARFFMQFTQNESCGKCVLCREGTRQMLSLLDDIIEGRADEKTLETLEILARTVQKGSLCGLGKTAPNPVLSAMDLFMDEVKAHVVDKRCPAKQCKALLEPAILPLLCKGCGLCARECPVGAISGERKKPYTIDPELCVRCGVCASVCRFEAVEGVGS